MDSREGTPESDQAGYETPDWLRNRRIIPDNYYIIRMQDLRTAFNKPYAPDTEEPGLQPFSLAFPGREYGTWGNCKLLPENHPLHADYSSGVPCPWIDPDTPRYIGVAGIPCPVCQGRTARNRSTHITLVCFDVGYFMRTHPGHAPDALHLPYEVWGNPVNFLKMDHAFQRRVKVHHQKKHGGKGIGGSYDSYAWRLRKDMQLQSGVEPNHMVPEPLTMHDQDWEMNQLNQGEERGQTPLEASDQLSAECIRRKNRALIRTNSRLKEKLIRTRRDNNALQVDKSAVEHRLERLQESHDALRAQVVDVEMAAAVVRRENRDLIRTNSRLEGAVTSSQRDLDALREDKSAVEDRLECLRESQRCVVCFSAPRDALVLPCMHMGVCSACLSIVQSSSRGASAACPMCRTAIRSVLPLPYYSEEHE